MFIELDQPNQLSGELLHKQGKFTSPKNHYYSGQFNNYKMQSQGNYNLKFYMTFHTVSLKKKGSSCN